jgi:hypothetical protein
MSYYFPFNNYNIFTVIFKYNYEVKIIYTESDSRIGRWQGGALNFDQRSGAEAAKLEKFSDAGGSKFSGCPTPPEPILESRAVYTDSKTTP